MFFFAILTSFFTPHAYALENFSTDYSVDYSVLENGLTNVTLHVTLTNTTSQYYASSYKVQLGFNNIVNVKASDAGGPMSPILHKTSDGYSIELFFNQKVVGLGSKLTFTLTFDSPDISKQYGKIWEINIPGIANPDSFHSFNVNVKTPLSFGNPTYIKPAQTNNTLSFTKDMLGKSGISIAFGDKQVYTFRLLYHLSNKNLFPIHTEIALPPSTNYQEVFIGDISPKPVNVTVDNDGNWLAQYYLSPSQKLDVITEGKAVLSLTPKEQPLSQKDLALYLQSQNYWQTADSQIQKLARELKTPDAIFNYVVKTLNYDFSRVTDNKPRLGAVAALESPDSAVCLEFTDLFITLARAAGIPAREVDGFASTENSKQRPLSLVKDILHAWPEYYDTARNTWIMVDPTWDNTTGGVDYFNTMDFDHFAFVIKGLNSEYPIPAGGYKVSGLSDSKDVNIGFGDVVPLNEQNIELESNLPKVTLSGFPISGTLTIRNVGTSVFADQTLGLMSNTLFPHTQVIRIPAIPPFGYANVPVSFDHTSFLTNKNESFTIRLADRTIAQDIKVTPFVLNRFAVTGGISFVILALLILIITIRSGRIRLFR